MGKGPYETRRLPREPQNRRKAHYPYGTKKMYQAPDKSTIIHGTDDRKDPSNITTAVAALACVGCTLLGLSIATTPNVSPNVVGWTIAGLLGGLCVLLTGLSIVDRFDTR